MEEKINLEIAKHQDELNKLESAIQHIGKAGEVSNEVLEAIRGVESQYGTNLTQVLEQYKEYLEKAKGAMEELDNVKLTLRPQLENVKVRIDKFKNADVYDAMVQIFGTKVSDDPDKDFITFDEFMQCVQIIKIAGKSKGKETLARQGI